MRRREFITLVGGTVVAWPLAARTQQSAMPVVGFVSSRSLDGSARHAAAFAKGLSESGYIEGQNAVVEYHWLGGQNDRLPALMADLVRRRVAVIATLGDPSTLAAKAATATIPIAFGFSGDPVGHGLVASLARPGGNATGINFFASEVLAKRLGLLRENPDQCHEHRINVTRCAGGGPPSRASNSDSQRQHQPRDRSGLRHHGTRSRRRLIRRP